MSVTDRINRILFILSYVSKNQGVSEETLAQNVGMTPNQLIKELEFISLIGKPPFKPDDYVDIYVEDNRVFIEFDQSLNRPLRLTRPEAVALLMSLELLDPELDPEGVRTLREKIGETVSASVDGATRLEDRIVLDRPSLHASEHFQLIREAVERRQKIRLDYFTLTRNQRTSRVVRPYYLMKRLGSWYLTGYCESREDLRTFKFERILAAQPVDELFEEPSDFDVEKYKSDFLKSTGENRVEIYFDSKIAPWVREKWGEMVHSHPDGGVVLTIYSETMEFPSRLVLESAPHARPLSPPELIEKVRRDARDIYDLQEVVSCREG